MSKILYYTCYTLSHVLHFKNTNSLIIKHHSIYYNYSNLPQTHDSGARGQMGRYIRRLSVHMLRLLDRRQGVRFVSSDMRNLIIL